MVYPVFILKSWVLCVWYLRQKTKIKPHLISSPWAVHFSRPTELQDTDNSVVINLAPSDSSPPPHRWDNEAGSAVRWQLPAAFNSIDNKTTGCTGYFLSRMKLRYAKSTAIYCIAHPLIKHRGVTTGSADMGPRVKGGGGGGCTAKQSQNSTLYVWLYVLRFSMKNYNLQSIQFGKVYIL